jgi:DNA invertase Pin-like site-specific DNA recombinase
MARRTVTRRRKSDVAQSANASMRAAAYVRVSTEEQATEGVSLDAQLDRVDAYAAGQGLELCGVYRDEGVSASEPLATRPDGERLVHAIRGGEYTHVIALKLDRCFRSAVDCMQTVEEWTQLGVAVHLVDLGGQAVDTRSAMGKFFLTIMASCAELELNSIRERTRTALQHKRRLGERLGTTPLGFHTPAPGAALEPDARELHTVRRLLELCALDLPFTRVARELGMEGHRTKRGGPWHSASVRLIWLARERYAGLLGEGADDLTRAHDGMGAA